MKNFPGVADHGYEYGIRPDHAVDNDQDEYFVLTNRRDKVNQEAVSVTVTIIMKMAKCQTPQMETDLCSTARKPTIEIPCRHTCRINPKSRKLLVSEVI